MKKLLGLVVVLAALVLGGYYGTGLVTETTIEKNINVINQSNGLLVDISEYHRGWYQSKAVLNWRVHIPERLSKDQSGQTTTVPAQDYSIQMPLTIYHGPIIFSDSGIKFGLGYARSDVEIPDTYAKKFSNLFTDESTKPKLSLSLFVNYLANSQLHLGLPGFKLTLKQGGEKFEWNGMDSHVNVSSNLRNIDGGVIVDGASLTRDKMIATLGKVLSNYDLHQTTEGLYLGQASLSVPSFTVAENQEKILDLVEFEVTSSSDVNSGLFETNFQTSLNKMIVHGKTYGPATLKISLKNLDAKVLAEINEQANKMQQGTDAERQQALLSILPALPRLFGQGAQFEVSELSVVVPEGIVSGDMLISLPKGDTGNPFQLLQKVEGHGKLKIPATIVKGLMSTTIKQQLLSKPTLQQAMVQQIQNNDKPQVQEQAPVQAQESQAKAGAPDQNADGQTTTTAGQSQEQNKPMTIVEVEQQANAQTDQKLAAMVKSGLLSLQDKDYVIEVSLKQGQLSINDKPFNSAMLQY